MKKQFAYLWLLLTAISCKEVVTSEKTARRTFSKEINEVLVEANGVSRKYDLSKPEFGIRSVIFIGKKR